MQQKFNKAVRDKIPEIIVKKGKKCEVITLSDKEFLVEMERKMSEEINEYLVTKSVIELVDILEVVFRIAELNGIPQTELEKIRRQKVIERGAFAKNYFLIETS